MIGGEPHDTRAKLIGVPEQVSVSLPHELVVGIVSERVIFARQQNGGWGFASGDAVANEAKAGRRLGPNTRLWRRCRRWRSGW